MADAITDVFWSTESVEGNTNAPAPESKLFSAPDYIVFALSLTIPLGIGVFFFIRGLKSQSTEEFLLGDRSMNFVAVALSLIASILNGVFVIGVPAEIHYYGSRYMYQYFGLVFAMIITAIIFLPKFHSMKITSAYQYVEMRYNMATRVVASAFFCLSVTIFLAVVLYVPALAFAQVTNLSIYITIFITGVVCTLYTTIGGIKAVVWTDAIQMVILLVGLVVIVIVGTVKAGGSTAVWNAANQDGRLDFADFNPDPRARTSFWSQVLGATANYLGLFISNQMMVQRYLGVETVRKAQRSVIMAVTLCLPLFILIWFIGLVVHATYRFCDPLVPRPVTGPLISAGDKIFPLFLMDVMGKYHGIPGLLMSSIFAAALSSVSSVINALSAVCLEDFIDPAYKYKTGGKTLTDKQRRRVAVAVVIFFGCATIALSFAADSFTTKLVQATNTIWGVIGGPLASIFIMGFFFPFYNSKGAISGMIGGLIFALWISIGSIVHTPSPPSLPIGICNVNGTMVAPTTPSPTNPLHEFYLVSFAWYAVIGIGGAIIIGTIVSLATGGASKEHRESVRADLMYSMADNCCCCCPLACIQCYRCGVNYEDEDQVNLTKGSRSNKVGNFDDGTEDNMSSSDKSSRDSIEEIAYNGKAPTRHRHM